MVILTDSKDDAQPLSAVNHSNIRTKPHISIHTKTHTGHDSSNYSFFQRFIAIIPVVSFHVLSNGQMFLGFTGGGSELLFGGTIEVSIDMMKLIKKEYPFVREPSIFITDSNQLYP